VPETKADMTTVLIVDDDEAFREVIKRSLGPGVNVIGEGARGEDGVLLAAQLHPEVILMDLDLPGLDGITAIRQIKAANPEVKVILLTPHDEEAYLSSTGKTGADSILPKRAVRAEILSRIRVVASGFWSTWDGRDRRGRATPTGRWDGKERRRRRAALGDTPGGNPGGQPKDAE
jgi:DNA-binding NarL/FixJ family response regulator